MAAQFPPIGLKEDSKYFGHTKEDKAILSDTDGGYVYSRPRHARNPRRTFSTGFTNLTQGQLNSLDAFFDVRGCYMIFTYTIPTTGELVDVRFESPFTAKYMGVGGLHRYDVTDIKLVEV